jgi:myo-inositol-1(or 4)-monophosphatase
MDSVEQSERFELARQAARRAGSLLRSKLGTHIGVHSKDIRTNLVTEADTASEELIRGLVSENFPDDVVLGEEGGVTGSNIRHRWIVDPLDGTTNFLHGIPQFAISIGLEREGTVIAGVVYNPASDELFTAERGKGAFLNEQRLRVAGRRRLADAVVACALPHHGRGDLVLFRDELALVQERVAGLRRFGAASLDLAWTAAGRLDGFWERNLSPWDMAAGILMVREAGGFATDLEGGDAMFTTGDILAANDMLHRELLILLKKASAR